MKRVVVLGGSGFVGRALCEQWVAHFGAGGPRLLVPSRHRERCKHLFTLPSVDVVQLDISSDHALAQVLHGADAVVNLIAILHGTPDQFQRVHVDLPQRLVMACAKTGVRRLVHVSALGVGDDTAAMPSHYLRSKCAGERALWTAHGEGLGVTVLRPSVIFGAKDRFLNLFAQLLALAPAVPLAGAQARLQPVWVEDVGRALVHALLHPETAGQILECAGPKVWTLGEIVSQVGRWSGHPRAVVEVPRAVGNLQAAFMGLMPGEPPMSRDNLDSLTVPNVATGRYPRLEDWGITPAAMEAVAPGYLGQADRWASPLERFRAWAGR
jgi:uncharacterized protein YbjT (DUF2867 family)